MRLPVPPSRQIKWRRHPDSNRGMKDLQSSALPLGYVAENKWSGRRDLNPRPSPWQGDALPLSHFRGWCREAELNCRHADFQTRQGYFTRVKGSCQERGRACPIRLSRLLLITGVMVEIGRVGQSSHTKRTQKPAPAGRPGILFIPSPRPAVAGLPNK